MIEMAKIAAQLLRLQKPHFVPLLHQHPVERMAGGVAVEEAVGPLPDKFRAVEGAVAAKIPLFNLCFLPEKPAQEALDLLAELLACGGRLFQLPAADSGDGFVSGDFPEQKIEPAVIEDQCVGMHHQHVGGGHLLEREIQGAGVHLGPLFLRGLRAFDQSDPVDAAQIIERRVAGTVVDDDHLYALKIGVAAQQPQTEPGHFRSFIVGDEDRNFCVCHCLAHVDFAEFSCNINIHSPRAIDKPSKLFFTRFVGATPFFFEKYFRRNIDT